MYFDITVYTIYLKTVGYPFIDLQPVLIISVSQNTEPTSLHQPDGALCGRDAVHVSLWSDAQTSGHGLPGLLQHLHGPHGLFNVLKVLRDGEAEASARASTRKY